MRFLKLQSAILMQLCQVFLLLNKSLSVREPPTRQNIRKHRGPAPAARESRSSNRSPQTRPSSPRPPPRRAQPAPPAHKLSDSWSRPRLSRPGPLAPRRPDAPRRGRAGAPAGDRGLAAPPPPPGSAERRPPRGLRWAQGASGRGRRAASAEQLRAPGSHRPGRHLPAPHGTAAPQPSPGTNQLRPAARNVPRLPSRAPL